MLNQQASTYQESSNEKALNLILKCAYLYIIINKSQEKIRMNKRC